MKIFEPSSSAFVSYTDPETYGKIVDFDSVSDMWRHCVEHYSDRKAVYDVREYTFGEIESDVSHLRAQLSALGVKAGDRVCIYLPNSYEFVKAFLAITTLGAVAALLPIQLPGEAVFGCSYKFSSRVIITDEEHKSFCEMAEQRLGCKVVLASNTFDGEMDSVCVEAKAPCAIVFTGGTTGKNKGALLSNRAVMIGTKNGCFGTQDVFFQRYILVLPLTHVFGLIRNLLSSLYTGSEILICKNNKDMFRDIAMFKPTVLVLVPALVELALNLSKQFKRNMLGSDLKYIICGSAPVSPYLVGEYEKLGIKLLPGYGLTESANLVSGNPNSVTNPDSVGFAYPGQQLRIVDGELWIKGDNIMECYVGDEEETKNAFEDGWFKTGDLVKIDDEGYLYIVGRIKETIVLPSGEKINPADVEKKFNEISAVQDSLISDEVTEDGRTILSLQVYPRKVVLDAVGGDDRDAYLREEINKVNLLLPSYSRVSKIVVRSEDFKRSPSMKILRGKQ